jgi:hypothetical protein
VLELAGERPDNILRRIGSSRRLYLIPSEEKILMPERGHIETQRKRNRLADLIPEAPTTHSEWSCRTA